MILYTHKCLIAYCFIWAA